LGGWAVLTEVAKDGCQLILRERRGDLEQIVAEGNPAYGAKSVQSLVRTNPPNLHAIIRTGFAPKILWFFVPDTFVDDTFWEHGITLNGADESTSKYTLHRKSDYLLGGCTEDERPAYRYQVVAIHVGIVQHT
jgi:hypothetical protein